ncbi:Flavonoid 3'-monooxygenase [Sesamum angolense]|uniref:Flavonoid 3'-monooxygenase n=1 Tax=Sesamum angolense TaxID=2727404 RepID=A0AAE1WVL0_9LAMI|nr:Flavonoid 3'-monooxygenase [Sesamum angolense]
MGGGGSDGERGEAVDEEGEEGGGAGDEEEGRGRAGASDGKEGGKVGWGTGDEGEQAGVPMTGGGRWGAGHGDGGWMGGWGWNIIFGGTDTSSATIEWVMAELMRNPKVMKNAYTELNEVVGLNNIVEEFHIPKLVYLDAVIKETLRIHPIGPFLTPRTPNQSCTVGGYSIQKIRRSS